MKAAGVMNRRLSKNEKPPPTGRVAEGGGKEIQVERQ